MFTFVTRMIRDKYKSLIIYSIAGLIFLEMYIALYPMISEVSVQLEQMMKTLPAEFFKVFNLDQASMTFNNLESLLAMKHYSMMWPIMAIILAIALANYLIANEIDNGTVESLLSLPVKRSKIFISRYLTGLFMLVIFNAVTIFATILLAAIHNIDVLWQNHLTLFIGSIFFSGVCYSLAIFMSNIISDKGKATMATGGILMLSYIIGVLATLKDSLENLKYFSIFNYFNGEILLMKNAYPEHLFYALGGLTVLLTIGAFIRFKNRDISTS